MHHRSHLSAAERAARSKAAKLLHDRPFIAAGLIKVARVCGKPNCKCTRGEKHESWYLWDKRGRKKIIIPRHLEEEIKEWVTTYKEIMEQLDVISEQYVERFLAEKGEKCLLTKTS